MPDARTVLTRSRWYGVSVSSSESSVVSVMIPLNGVRISWDMPATHADRCVRNESRESSTTCNEKEHQVPSYGGKANHRDEGGWMGGWRGGSCISGRLDGYLQGRRTWPGRLPLLVPWRG